MPLWDSYNKKDIGLILTIEAVDGLVTMPTIVLLGQEDVPLTERLACMTVTRVVWGLKPTLALRVTSRNQDQHQHLRV